MFRVARVETKDPLVALCEVVESDNGVNIDGRFERVVALSFLAEFRIFRLGWEGGKVGGG